MFHLTAPFLAALLYSSATVHGVDAQAVDCTETFGDLIYPTLEVECPPRWWAHRCVLQVENAW